MPYVDVMMQHLDIVAMVLAIPVLVYVSFTDIREQRIPNNVMFPALAVALTIALMRPERWWLLLSGIFSLAFLLLPSILTGKRQIGGGDLKLGLFLGLVLGWPIIYWSMIGSVAFFAVFCVVGLFVGRLKVREKVAYGPFLSLAAFVVGTFAVLWQLGV